MELTIISPKYGSFTAFIDDEDNDKVSQYNWTLDVRANGRKYARASVWIAVNKFSYVYLHRLIMGFPAKCQIDHRDNNGLNNIKSNLRITPVVGGGNSKNRGANVNSTTGFKGVYLYTEGQFKGKYSAKIESSGKKIWGGYFNTALEAANKANELMIEHHKEFSKLNEFTYDEKIELSNLLEINPKRKLRTYSKHKYRGISKPSKAPKSKPFMVRMLINKKVHYLGYFTTELEAAKAYNEAIIKNGGKKAFLNKIPNE